MPQFQQDRALATERDTLYFRVLAIAAIAVTALVLDEPLREPLGWPLWSLVGGYLAYSVFLNRFLLPRYPNTIVVVFMLLADVGAALATFLVVGFNSSMFIALPVLVIYHSMYLGYVGGLVTATLSSAGYAALTEWKVDAADMDPIYAIQIPFLYLIALMAGYLAARRIGSPAEREALLGFMDREARTRVAPPPVADPVAAPAAPTGETSVEVSPVDAAISRIARLQNLQVRTRIQVGPLVLEPRTEKVTLDGSDVSLSKTEFDVLYLLALKPGTPIHQDNLLHGAWGEDFVAQGNVVDVCVHRIRRKLLRAKPWGGQCVQTVRGQGYMVVAIDAGSGA
ncbi:MAG: winged helix-turn-helix transcriptional regulator [SAR202 cluster bacterium]|nr:winged helix-turn-helix transcriptional regulator [SAR202 cluster bacterium]